MRDRSCGRRETGAACAPKVARRLGAILAFAPLLSILGVSPAPADAFLGIHYGLRGFYADELNDVDVDRAPVLGIQIFASQAESPLAGEFAYWKSSGDGRVEDPFIPSLDVETELQVTEIALGLGYQGGADGLLPWYLGAGLSAVSAEFEVEGSGEDESSIGAYLTGMIRRRTGEYVSIGAAARFLFFAELEGVDLDCAQATVFLALGR